ncbi:hypothetical protein N6L26_05130 [Qipengyuania sp. SS22]|uniref:hypothetical protein n=1 Tax=Qipengyuania sp. SS22 TaxID=2979461 RepID=UPI0021E5AA95|nr:hypothetical protein [Qipengyuania sp. SS22]UYH55941.1 hypothetical protein N6L26_05130 [Qipengyuania sp. SS22]
MAILRRFLPVPVLALTALGACDRSPTIDAEGGTPVACALRGASDFASECRLVKMGEGSARYFVMRHPDGGFRKLASADTPSGLVEFDGAQRAESQRLGDEIVLVIGDDRYRWEAPRDE